MYNVFPPSKCLILSVHVTADRWKHGCKKKREVHNVIMILNRGLEDMNKWMGGRASLDLQMTTVESHELHELHYSRSGLKATTRHQRVQAQTPRRVHHCAETHLHSDDLLFLAQWMPLNKEEDKNGAVTLHCTALRAFQNNLNMTSHVWYAQVQDSHNA